MSTNSDLDSKLLSRTVEVLTSPLQGLHVEVISPDLAFFKTLQDASVNFTTFINNNYSIKQQLNKSQIPVFPLHTHSCIAPDDFKQIYYEYTSHLLSVTTLIAEENNNKFINLSLQSLIAKLFQFIFSLCIVPFLVPGNGPPLSERSVTLQYLIKHRSKLTLSTLTCHLIRCHDVILKQSHITYLTPHLRDVIASLLQISYYNGCEDVTLLAESCVWYRERCSELLARFETPLLVSEIMVLQGLARQAGASWVIKVTSEELSKILIGQLGIQSVIRGFLDVISKQLTPDAMDYPKLKVIAKVITTAPGREKNKYYNSVCDQLMDILHLRNESLKRDVITAGMTVIEALIVNQSLIAERTLLDKITLPLERMARESTAVMSEVELNQVIDDIHDVIARIPEWHKLVGNWISRYILILFHLYCFDVGKVTSIRTNLSQIIHKYFLNIEAERCVSFVREVLAYFHTRHTQRKDSYLTIHSSLSVSMGEEGGLQVIQGESESDVTVFISQLYLLLEKKENCGAYKSVLLSLLTWLSDLVEGRDKACKQCSSYQEGVLYLVAQLLEERGEYVLSELDTEPVLQWISRVVCIHHDALDKYYDLDEYNAGLFGGTSTLSMAYGSLTFLLSSSKEVSIEISKLLQDLLPYMEELSERFPDGVMREQSADLRICIATCGAVWSDLLTTATTPDKAADCNDDTNVLHRDKSSSFSEAIAHSLDPMLPIRANGIQQLSKLLYKRDKEALNKADQLFKLFKENLNSEDSYLYLAAINGIASLAYVRPREVLSDISAQFALFTQQSSTPLVEEISNDRFRLTRTPASKINTVKFRIKLGEVLMRAARESGDVFPHYGDVILRALLSGVRDRDVNVRASALSNLAECCVLLGYSLTKCVEEVMSCLEHLIPSEPDATVRCAAVLVLSRLLDKPQEQILQIFGGSLLRRCYKLLKLVHSSDPDLPTRTHAQCGLERLNGVMKQFLTPVTTRDLKKTLYVIDKPPEAFDWRK